MIKGIKKYGKADRRCDTGNFIVLWGIMPLLMYDVFAILPGFNHEHPDDSEVNDDYWQPWEVNEDLFDCMRAYYNDVQDNKIKTYDLGEGCESDTE